MLNTAFNFTKIAIIAGICSLLLANDGIYRNWDNHPCYAQAMIAHDSVINARLGMHAEQLMEIAENHDMAGDEAVSYSPLLLNTVLGAYLWKQSAYQYAVEIFYQCANSTWMSK